MSTVITVANRKGGCGKTTLTVSLASALVKRGYKVTVVDADPQCNATQSFQKLGEDFTDGFTIADAYLAKKPASQIELDFGERFDGRLFLVPGNKGLGTVKFKFDSDVQSALVSQEITEIDADDLKNEQRQRLAHSLDSLRGKRDFIIVDTGPDLGFILTTSLVAADRYLIPVVPSGYDLQGLQLISKHATQVQQRYKQDLQLLGVLLGKVKRTKLDSDIRELLLGSFGDDVLFDTEITDSVRLREATVHGLTILEHDPEGPSSTQFLELADEVAKRVGLLTEEPNANENDPAPAGEVENHG